MKLIRKTGKQEGCSRLLFLSCVPAFLIVSSSGICADPVVIGSKKFTESYVLGEIATRTLNDAGVPAQHRQGMGHDHSLASIARRTDRCVSGIHRHDRAGNSE